MSGTPTLAGTSSFTAKVTDAQGKTATFATSITILSSMLTIAVSASPATVAPGGTVSYTITATNSGQTALTGATFTDPLTDVLDDASYNSDASATAGSVSFASPNLTWTGNLAVGASATITFSVTVKNPDTGNKTLASTVTSTTSSSNCASGSTDTRCSSSVKVSVLTIAMTASPATANPGTTVSYTITVTNAGTAAYTGAAFTDPLSGVLDDASYNSDASATAGSLSFASSSLTWTGDLAAGASATVTFSVTVNNPDTGNKILASTITSATAGSNCASGSTDTRCASTVTVLVPGLTTTVSAGTSTTTPGQTVHLHGDRHQLRPDRLYRRDVHQPAGRAAGRLHLQQRRGRDRRQRLVRQLQPDLDRKPGGGGDRDGHLLGHREGPRHRRQGPRGHHHLHHGGQQLPGREHRSRCTATVPVLVPGLQISASAGSATTAPGSVVQYTVTVTNSGQTPYTGATFTDPLSGVLDDASYNNNAAATSGSVSFASPNLTWTGNLALGAAATITFSVTVSKPDTGNKILASTITSATRGSNCAAGSGDPPCTTSVPVAVLTITNTANVGTTTPGGVVRFTGTFTNTGQVAYTGITIAGTSPTSSTTPAPTGTRPRRRGRSRSPLPA